VTRFALRAVLGRKLRTALTALAVVLGVAMISGTYVLTDSIDQAFDRLFSEIRATSTAVVTGKPAFDLAGGGAEPTFDEALLGEIRALPGVAEAEGSVSSDSTQIIGRDGKALVFGGAPNLGFSIANGESRFNPLALVEGTWPGPGEVAIDARTASEADLEVGETIGIQAEGPAERLRLVGTFEFRAGLFLGGATLAGFDLATAQRLFDKVGTLDEIAIAAKPGVEPEELVAQVEEILPPGTQVRTGEEQAAAEASETSEFISFLRTFLLAFAGIALFVGSFVIANSLSITIAQRTREFATLRTIGATSRQVLGAVLVESLVVAIVASVVGIFAGLALATGLFELFDALGFTLPNTGLVLETRTIIVALAAGIVVTVLASVYPGLRATSVPSARARPSPANRSMPCAASGGRSSSSFWGRSSR
jgi:putative ABC transport system permease protein